MFELVSDILLCECVVDSSLINVPCARSIIGENSGRIKYAIEIAYICI